MTTFVGFLACLTQTFKDPNPEKKGPEMGPFLEVIRGPMGPDFPGMWHLGSFYTCECSRIGFTTNEPTVDGQKCMAMHGICPKMRL